MGAEAPHNIERLQQLARFADPRRQRISCPTCRQPSNHVIAAIAAPTTEGEKELLKMSFYKQKKRKLCKWFEFSVQLGHGLYCPSWNDCLYAHLLPTEPDKLRKDTYIFTQDEIDRDRAVLLDSK
jgi:hypothetical protein